MLTVSIAMDTPYLRLSTVSGRNGHHGVCAPPHVVGATVIAPVPVYSLNLEGTLVKDRRSKQSSATLHSVPWMGTGMIGLAGVSVQPPVQMEHNSGQGSVMDLPLEEPNARATGLKIGRAFQDSVQWMENGKPGLVGNHAPRAVMVEHSFG